MRKISVDGQVQTMLEYNGVCARVKTNHHLHTSEAEQQGDGEMVV